MIIRKKKISKCKLRNFSHKVRSRRLIVMLKNTKSKETKKKQINLWHQTYPVYKSKTNWTKICPMITRMKDPVMKR